MEEKRKGYKTKEGQKRANERYLKNNPEAKEKKKINSMRSNTKRFINEFATIEELEELEKMIEKEKESLKMKKLWKDVKNLIIEMNVDSDNIDMRTGDCTVDLIGGKYNGWAVAGKVDLDGDYKEITIDDNAVVYNPAE